MLLKKKKLISLLLAFTMIFAILITNMTTAFAEGDDIEDATEAEDIAEVEIAVADAELFESALVVNALIEPPSADVTLPPAQP